MPDTFTFSTPMELKVVEQDLLPTLVEDDPVFKILPIEEVATTRLRWRQLDNFTGLQQVRGLNGKPKNVKMVGMNEFEYKPGYYGEFVTFDEEELTERGEMGSWDEPADINDLVGLGQQFLLQRRVDRIRYINFQLLANGSFTVANGRGEVMHVDSFAIQTLTASVAWGTFATATPIANIRAAQLLSRGHSVDFGRKAELWMNRGTFNNFIGNTNANDLFGRRADYGSTFNEVDAVNKLLAANDLPSIVIYDKTYNDDNNVTQLFLPNNRAILVGNRTNGARIGAYRMTRNAGNPKGEPGAVTRVIDRREFEVPGSLELHDMHNGGPILELPSSIVSLTV